MSAAYTSDEMVSVSVFSKNLARYRNKLYSDQIEKVALMRNNAVDLVVLPSSRYEKMSHALEKLEDLLEHVEIAREIEESEKMSTGKTYSLEEVMEKYGITQAEIDAV